MGKLVSFKNVSYSIPFTGVLLSDVSFEIQAGELLGVIGLSESRKNILIDLIMGIRTPTSGSVLVLGENPHQGFHKYKDKIIFLSQDIFLKSNITIEQLLAFKASFHPSYIKQEELRLLLKFNFDPKSTIGSLSIGQQRMVQVISALASAPKLIILDEVLNMINSDERFMLIQEIHQHKEKFDTSFMLVSDNGLDLIESSEKVILIKDESISILKPDEVFSRF